MDSRFVGQRLLQALSRCGAEVTALVRDDKRIPQEIQAYARFVVGDLRDSDRLESLMRGSSIVIHTAAVTTNAVPWSVHHDTNVLGTENVVRAAAACGVDHVVHVSSVAVYGLENRPGAVLETDALPERPDRWAYYIRTKLEAERKAVAIAVESGMDLSIMRLGLLYGPGAARPAGRGLVQLGSWRFVLGTGRNHLPYTYIDNAVDALLLAAAKSHAGIEAYNIVDGPPKTVADAAREDGQVRGEKVRLVPVPPIVLSTLARSFEYRNRNKDTAPKLTRYVVRSATRDIVYDTRKAQERLGWEPVIDLERGLRITHGWRA
jgi:nucleoside-diphosphate-sugar epimerase